MGVLSKLKKRKEVKVVEETKIEDDDYWVREIEEGFEDALIKFARAKSVDELFGLYGMMLKGLYEFTKDLDDKTLRKVLSKTGFIDLFVKVRNLAKQKT